MKKITATFLCLIASCSSIQARVFQLGPRIGISAAQIKIREQASLFADSSFIQGYQAGVVTRLHLPVLYLQPELLITSSENKYSWQVLDLKHIKLELPVMVGISLGGLLRIQAGPIISLPLRAKEGDSHIKESWGYQAGLGIDIWRIMLDFKYEDGLPKLGHKLTGIETDPRVSLFILGIAFNLL
ncbi:MAG: hypothetical protein AAF392_01905 [Bacteroidota bacterium]